MSENRQKTDSPKRKAPKTAFGKGVSGNPGGRPKRTAEELDLIAACKDRTPAALAVIESIMMDSITASAAGVRSLHAAIRSNSSAVLFGRPPGFPDTPFPNAVLGAFRFGLSVFCLFSDISDTSHFSYSNSSSGTIAPPGVCRHQHFLPPLPGFGCGLLGLFFIAVLK